MLGYQYHESWQHAAIMTGIELRSLADLKRYTKELASKQVEQNAVLQKLHVAQRITWMILLAGALLFYYLVDKLLEALSILK